MSLMAQNQRLLKAILANFDQIQQQVGDQWPAFRQHLLSLLQRLAQAETEQTTTEIVDEILELGFATEAADLFRQLLNEAQAEDLSFLEGASRGGVGQPKGEVHGVTLEPISGGTLSVSDKVEIDLVSGKLTGVAFQDWGDGDDNKARPLEAAPKETPALRFLNAGFFTTESEQLLPIDQPLLFAQKNYRLGVNVGTFWGPGAPGEAALDEILAEALKTQAPLKLVVAVRSRSVKVTPAQAMLILPTTGDSPLLFFNLSFGRPARHALNVDLFYQGHLLQSRHVEVEVVREAQRLSPLTQPDR